MADYPIVMKQKNDQGQYDNLYPKTLSTQIEGNIPSTQITGTFPSTSITGTFPASQITGLPTSLPANGGNADTVGGQSVQQIIQSALAQGMKIETGSYVGVSSSGTVREKSLSFNFPPEIVIINSEETGAIGIFLKNCVNYQAFGIDTPSTAWFSYGTCNFNGNTLIWRSSGNWGQDGDHSYGMAAIMNLDLDNKIYNYIAIG